MTDETKNQHAARFLYDAHRDGSPFEPLPGDLSPTTIEEAYGMQEAFQGLLAPERGPARRLQRSR